MLGSSWVAAQLAASQEVFSSWVSEWHIFNLFLVYYLLSFLFSFFIFLFVYLYPYFLPYFSFCFCNNSYKIIEEAKFPKNWFAVCVPVGVLQFLSGSQSSGSAFQLPWPSTCQSMHTGPQVVPQTHLGEWVTTSVCLPYTRWNCLIAPVCNVDINTPKRSALLGASSRNTFWHLIIFNTVAHAFTGTNKALPVTSWLAGSL
jgi:hypothetical protein